MPPSTDPDIDTIQGNISTPATRITKLILVACHAIWLGGPTNGDNESEWALSSFQHGETGTFIAHAEIGVEELIKANGCGLLVFSGGATKRAVTARSEAESYHDLVRARRMLPASNARLVELIHEERLAVDSFQNLLLSLLLFCRVVGQPPAEIVLVTHAFKRERFLDLHCSTIRWDPAAVVFRGLDPGWGGDEDGRKKRADTEKGEAVTRLQWRDDPWGWRSVLGKKRTDRGWAPTEGLHEAVFWDGGQFESVVYRGVLPWDQ